MEMSNDLISRKALLEELKEKVYPERFGQRCNALDVIGAVLRVIGEQPISYDVDNVIDQLDDISYDCMHIAKHLNMSNTWQIMDSEKVFDIVKAGGIDNSELIGGDTV